MRVNTSNKRLFTPAAEQEKVAHILVDQDIHARWLPDCASTSRASIDFG